MNDIAHKITERLYDGDKVKFEIIFHFLNLSISILASLTTYLDSV